MPRKLWNDQEAAGRSELELLVYRSRLLGADRSICNIYGGNTSAKTTELDFRGRPIATLWVKGSGSDLAEITLDDFAALRFDDILPLFERDQMTDEEMVEYLSHCYLRPGMPRPSIETLLHAFVPAAHVDHTHPDAIVSLAASANGEEHVRRLFGDQAIWVPYVRPGFTLSKWIGEAVRERRRAVCVVMAKHGLVTWGDNARSCYDQTIRVIEKAEEYIAERGDRRRVFGVVMVPPLPDDRRQAAMVELLPVIRGAVSRSRYQVLRYDCSPEVLAFVGAERAREIAQVGAACPDHLVHTKHWPLFVEWDGFDLHDLKVRLPTEIERYRERYAGYFEAHRTPRDTMMDPSPRVILIPGLGMVTVGKDSFLATVTRDLYYRAIAVMQGATALGQFISLTPAEAFAVEYWPLELYKLTLRPPERELTGRVAVVTGGASGIGRAVVYRLAQEGAHVVILDINRDGAEAIAADLAARYGQGRSLAVACDVSDEEQVIHAFRQATLCYGGVDIVVNNAGIAHSAPVTETDTAAWDRLYRVLARGYFLVAREAFRLWSAQGLGGAMVIVASKNALVAGKNAAAYSSAKAAEVHLARCLAEEGGELGIRVNVVCPDAVISGSGLWDTQWREERARTYGILPEELEEFYRQRTTLKVNVFPEDVAEAVLFFASDRSAKTTGGILTVDGGVPAAFVR